MHPADSDAAGPQHSPLASRRSSERAGPDIRSADRRLGIYRQFRQRLQPDRRSAGADDDFDRVRDLRYRATRYRADRGRTARDQGPAGRGTRLPARQPLLRHRQAFGFRLGNLLVDTARLGARAGNQRFRPQSHHLRLSEGRRSQNPRMAASPTRAASAATLRISPWRFADA